MAETLRDGFWRDLSCDQYAEISEIVEVDGKPNGNAAAFFASGARSVSEQCTDDGLSCTCLVSF